MDLKGFICPDEVLIGIHQNQRETQRCLTHVSRVIHVRRFGGRRFLFSGRYAKAYELTVQASAAYAKKTSSGSAVSSGTLQGG